eukprot:12365907-Alexandrium_andersonii.AAC.1
MPGLPLLSLLLLSLCAVALPVAAALRWCEPCGRLRVRRCAWPPEISMPRSVSLGLADRRRAGSGVAGSIP